MKKILINIAMIFLAFTVSAQRNPRNIEMDWSTDTTNRSIDLFEIRVSIKRDAILAIDNPKYYDVATAEKEYSVFAMMDFHPKSEPPVDKKDRR